MAELQQPVPVSHASAGNAQPGRWNTMTGALWKGDRAPPILRTEQPPTLSHVEGPIPSIMEISPDPVQTSTQPVVAAPSSTVDTLSPPAEPHSHPTHTDEHSAHLNSIEEDQVVDDSVLSQGRSNVHFAQTVPDDESLQLPNGSFLPQSTDRPFHTRNSSFMAKMLARSPSSQVRAQGPQTPAALQEEHEEQVTPSRFSRHFERIAHPARSRSIPGEQDADADGEDTGGEEQATRPITTGQPRRPRLHPAASDSPSGITMRRKSPTRRRPHFPGRSATVQEERQGLSEDEGRARLSRSPAWRRKSSSWLRKDTDQGTQSGPEGTDTARPSARRFFSSRPGGAAVAEGNTGGRRVRGEGRAHEAWQKIRNRMTLIVQKSKAEQIDQTKSAELMAELLAGSPAALILASSFQRDEREKKRIPVLLEQLKISIPSSTPLKEDSSADRHLSFHIELEYGSGLMRMKWTIDRTLRDFVNLHLKYKSQRLTQKFSTRRATRDDTRTKLPKFPRSAFPVLGGNSGVDDEDDEDETAEEQENLRTPASENPPRRVKRNSGLARRQSSIPGVNGTTTTNGSNHTSSIPNVLDLKRETFNTRQRKKLEQYLQHLIRFVIFGAGSNRLCRFLELSALGIRLASEGSYHGKEGTLVLQSGKGIDFRKAWTPGLLIQRHKPMWFLVRHSYLVCVDSPEEMNIYDVFLVDSGFQVQSKRPRLRDQKNVSDFTKTAGKQVKHPQHLILRLENHERKVRLFAKNDRQLQQFEDSLRLVRTTTDWARPHRHDSFAPIRRNVFAQWLVDGRDYMWNLSRAISMAQDVIYIHDWWLSPEIYLRRPAAISKKWRLDRLLKQKAEEGVKIFVIVYRNINSAIPIDSEYTKFSLLDLHPNVFVQRSPNQLRQNTFFWAHHEKICVVDHVVAFCGGVDLCFGRWDAPQHIVTDDKPTGFEPGSNEPLDADHCQLWAGKDYSNPRVLDFFKLDEPYGEMYDRTKVPRMPWHDIGMQIVGQPARDLSRHFVQRWNYILRQRKPSRPTPFLLPPPDFAPHEVETLGLDGTCDVQILRSACDWSIGTPHRVEHSILNCYEKLILDSDHFVYIENQFFITSCNVEGTKIRNTIGDALVDRVKKAHHNGEKWRAVIIVPLMPGFQNTVDAQDGTSIRLIMQCQYRSIDRGEESIFGRLKAANIDPAEYIEFYSLRSWGKIGPTKALVTEQLYIHAKVMVVDDRHAIIGSANINERSLLGERDSEIAAVVFDKDMIDSTMAGIPYKVGRFPHTLRMRLMREHLGLDVDAIMEEERAEQYREEEAFHAEHQRSGTSDTDRGLERKLMQSKHRQQDDLIARYENMHTFNHDVDWEQEHNPHLLAHKKVTADPRVTNNPEHRADVEGFGFDKMAETEKSTFLAGRDTVILKGDKEVLQDSTIPEGRGTLAQPSRNTDGTDRSLYSHSAADSSASSTPPAQMPPAPPSMHEQDLGLAFTSQLPPLPVADDTDINGPPLIRQLSHASAEVFNPLLASMRRPVVTKDCMRDPLASSFFRDIWHAVAANNTKLFRQVFRCMPDSNVTNWKEYAAANAYTEKFANSQGMSKSHTKMQHETHGETGPPGHGAISALTNPLANVLETARGMVNTEIDRTDEMQRMRSHTGNSMNEKSNPQEDNTGTAQQTPSKATDNKNFPLNEKHSAGLGKGNRVDFGNTLNTPSRPRATTVGEKISGGLDKAVTVDSRDAPPRPRAETYPEKSGLPNVEPPSNAYGTQKRRKRTTTKSSGGTAYDQDHMPSKEDAEELLKLVQGHLIEWPYNWLVQEERGSKWLYSVDTMAPLEIYN